MSITGSLYVLAFVCFVLAGFQVPTPQVSWRDMGFALLTLSLFVR